MILPIDILIFMLYYCRDKYIIGVIHMTPTEKYHSYMYNPDPKIAFTIQGQAFNDYLLGKISFYFYSKFYWFCEDIMGRIDYR